MLAVGMYILLFAIRCADNLFAKKFQLGFKFDFPHFVYYNFINAFIATVLYLFSVGFKFNLNFVTVAMAFIYAAQVFFSLVYSLIALRHLTMPLNTLLSMSGSLLGSTLFGWLALEEKITVRLLIAMAAVIAAVILPGGEIASGKYKLSKKGVICCFVTFFSSIISTVISNIYLAVDNIEPKQYYMLTNVWLVIVCGAIMLFYLLKGKIKLNSLIHLFSIGQLCIIGGRTALSNISALVSIFILTIMPLSVNSVIGSVLSIVAVTVVSKLYFKERLTVRQVIALLLVGIAAALCAI